MVIVNYESDVELEYQRQMDATHPVTCKKCGVALSRRSIAWIQCPCGATHCWDCGPCDCGRWNAARIGQDEQC